MILFFHTVLFISLIATLLIVRFFTYVKEEEQGWLIKNSGGHICYQELDIKNRWQRIDFPFETYDNGYPRHVIYIQEDWKHLPYWAQENKSIILERLRSKYRSPVYTFVFI